MTGYISDAIAPLLKEKYLKILETSPFSISIDEGCAKGNVQYLAVNARFLPHTESVKTKTKLIGLIAMGTSSSGKTVFDEVYKLLFSDKEGAERRKQNFIGISTDAASAMISKKEAGATNRLLSQFEQLIVVHDYCHALNLVLEKSVLSFPEYYFTMVKKICSVFSHSPQKVAKLKEYMSADESTKDVLIKTIKKFIPTRWSSLFECVTRILELKSPLKEYFNQDKPASDEYDFLVSAEDMEMLKLFQYLLGIFDFYIKFFQGEDIDTVSVVSKLKECIIIVHEFVIKFSENDSPIANFDDRFKELEIYLTSQHQQNNLIKERTIEEFETYFLSKSKLFRDSLANNTPQFRQKFFVAAKRFLDTAALRIREYLPLKNQLIMSVDCFLMNRNSAIKELDSLASHFTNVISKDEFMKFSLELDRLAISGTRIMNNLKISPSSKALEIWFQEHNEYPLICKLVRAIAAYPYSTAGLERTFSKVTDIKTIKRNRLDTKNLEACLLIKQEYGDKELEFTTDVLDRYSNRERKTKLFEISHKDENQNELIATDIKNLKEEEEKMEEESYTTLQNIAQSLNPEFSDSNNFKQEYAKKKEMFENMMSLSHFSSEMLKRPQPIALGTNPYLKQLRIAMKNEKTENAAAEQESDTENK